MRPSEHIALAFQGLRRNAMRSLLTTLGIIIGVGSVVLMLSIGASFQKYILDQVSTFSGNTFEVHPKGFEQFGKDTNTITNADFDAVAALPTVQSVAPVVFVGKPVRFGRETMNALVFGTTANIFGNFSQELARGRALSDADVKGSRSVAVIGPKAAEDLFGDKDPLGERITIGNDKFAVIGVLKGMGSALSQQMDATVYIPISIARSITNKTLTVDYISLQSKGQNDLTSKDITQLLRARHKIDNPQDDPNKDDFTVRSFQQAADIIGTVTLSITVFLGLIAGISLLVGGIGIMNIMLVSVTERTPEIGLRKAVGARNNDILFQFLVEAVVLTLGGGLIGIAGGLGLGFILARITAKLLGSFSFALSGTSILLSLGMALAIGLGFGLYPARRASLLDPIEALRRE